MYESWNCIIQQMKHACCLKRWNDLHVKYHQPSSEQLLDRLLLVLGSSEWTFFLLEEGKYSNLRSPNFDNCLIWHTCDGLIKSVICMTNINRWQVKPSASPSAEPQAIWEIHSFRLTEFSSFYYLYVDSQLVQINLL